MDIGEDRERVWEGSVALLPRIARIPIAFRVEAVLVPEGPDAGSWRERPVTDPYLKDYDAPPGEGPLSWPARFDCVRWGFLAVGPEAAPAGAATIAFDTPGLDLLEGRRDLALLWDLRVAPAARGRGLGAALFAAAERQARARGATELRVETQDVNAPACRFYARRGCRVVAVRPGAYPALPHETQVLFGKPLGPAARARANS